MYRTTNPQVFPTFRKAGNLYAPLAIMKKYGSLTSMLWHLKRRLDRHVGWVLVSTLIHNRPAFCRGSATWKKSYLTWGRSTVAASGATAIRSKARTLTAVTRFSRQRYCWAIFRRRHEMFTRSPIHRASQPDLITCEASHHRRWPHSGRSHPTPWAPSSCTFASTSMAWRREHIRPRKT